MVYIIEMKVKGEWREWNRYSAEHYGIEVSEEQIEANCMAGFAIARNYGECRIIKK